MHSDRFDKVKSVVSSFSGRMFAPHFEYSENVVHLVWDDIEFDVDDLCEMYLSCSCIIGCIPRTQFK